MLKLGDLLKAAGLSWNDSNTPSKKQSTTALRPQKSKAPLPKNNVAAPTRKNRPSTRKGKTHHPDHYNERSTLKATPTPGPASHPALGDRETFKDFTPPPSKIPFKHTPSPWIAQGQKTQSDFRNGAPTPRLPIHIGIDFGTAFTKVAVKVKEKIYIVDWSGVIQEETPYLLPGELSILRNGTTLLGNHSEFNFEVKDVVNNLKIPFLPKEDYEEYHVHHTICFLAWVMKYTRAWIFNRLSRQIEPPSIITWDVTLGIPTETWDKNDDSDICEKIAIRAWNTSLMDDVSLSNAESTPSSLDNAHDLNTLTSQPEFLAEVMSYSKSPQCTKGLHFFCDIGAGTLDLCTIVIDEPQHQTFTYSVLEANVHLLGLWHLEHQDSQGEAQIKDKIYRAIAGILRKTKASRYSRFFINGTPLPYSLLGGGRSDQRYLEQLRRRATHLNDPIKLSEPPIDIRLGKSKLETDLPDDIANRFLVATGLCWNDEDFGNITRSRDIDDISPSAPGEQIDTGELYSD